MKNSSLLIILAVVASIVVVSIYTNTNKVGTYDNNYIGKLEVLQETGVSYYTITQKGYTMKTNIYSQPSANVHIVRNAGFGYGTEDLGTGSTDGYGMLTFTPWVQASYTITISKTGYKPLTFTLDLPQANKPSCFPWDSDCQNSVPKETRIDVFLALESSTSSDTFLIIKTTPYDCDVKLEGNGYFSSEDSGTTGAIFKDVPSGSYTATVTKLGYQSKTVIIPSNLGTYTCNLQKISTCCIMTTPDAFVQISNSGVWLKATADQEGAVFFELTTGTKQVVISKSGYTSGYHTINIVEGENKFVFPLNWASAPPNILVVRTNYDSDIVVEGIGSKLNTGEAEFTIIESGEFQVTATSKCSGEILYRTISFPEERSIYFEFPLCKPKGPPTYLLTIVTNPSDCIVTPYYWGEAKNTGVDGASWSLYNGHYEFDVEKDKYDTKKISVTINGEDDLIVVNLDFSKKYIPPTVSLSAPATAGKNELVTFVASGDRDILYYQFNFGDGKISDWTRTYVMSHYYRDIGNYMASVQVKTVEGLLGSTDTEKISIDQIWQTFVPYIEASDTIVGKITDVTVALPTNLEIDNYYLQAYVRTNNGSYLVPRWSTIDTNFSYGTIIGKFQYICNETGEITIAAKGIAMDPLNYKNTEEVIIAVDCLVAGTTTAVTDDSHTTTEGGSISSSSNNFVVQYFISIGIIVFLCIIVIIILIVLIVRLKKHNRRKY